MKGIIEGDAKETVPVVEEQGREATEIHFGQAEVRITKDAIILLVH